MSVRSRSEGLLIELAENPPSRRNFSQLESAFVPGAASAHTGSGWRLDSRFRRSGESRGRPWQERAQRIATFSIVGRLSFDRGTRGSEPMAGIRPSNGLRRRISRDRKLVLRHRLQAGHRSQGRRGNRRHFFMDRAFRRLAAGFIFPERRSGVWSPPADSVPGNARACSSTPAASI